MSDAAALVQQIPSEPLSSILSSLRKPIALPHPLSTLFYNLPTPQIIDIHSPSHTGKTHFLYYLITQTILPDTFTHYGIRLTSTPSRAVVFLDCDSRFDVLRLTTVITTSINDRLSENAQGGFIHPTSTSIPSTTEIKHLIHQSLTNLYIFQPTSGLDVLATIHSLKPFLQDPSKAIQLGMICIDSLTSFHHVIRAQDRVGDYYARLANSLRHLSTLFNIPILVTSWALYEHAVHENVGRSQYMGTGPSHPHAVSLKKTLWRQYFPGEWLRNVDRRIVLQRREVRGFVMGIGLEEAERERERRDSVVKRGSVVGWLEGDERREFEMFITESGVRIPM